MGAGSRLVKRPVNLCYRPINDNGAFGCFTMNGKLRFAG